MEGSLLGITIFRDVDCKDLHEVSEVAYGECERSSARGPLVVAVKNSYPLFCDFIKETVFVSAKYSIYRFKQKIILSFVYASY